MTEFFIAYAIIAATNINEIFVSPIWVGIIGVAVIVTGAVIMTATGNSYENEEEKNSRMTIHNALKKFLKAIMYFAIFGFLAAALIPNRKDAAYIFGIGMGLKVLNNEQVQKVPENALKLINGFMEEQVEELNTKRQKAVVEPVVEGAEGTNKAAK